MIVLDSNLGDKEKQLRTQLGAGANPNEQDESGKTILMEVSSDDYEGNLVKILLEGGADPNIQDNAGNTALMHASGGLKGAVKFLLKAGADPNIQNKQGETPLIKPSKWNYCEIVEMLLKAGADPDKKDRNSDTPLILNIKAGGVCVKKLLEYGANIPLNALDIAYKTLEEKPHYANYLIIEERRPFREVNHGLTVAIDLLQKEIDRRYREYISEWDDVRARDTHDVFEENEYGDTPLIIASHQGNLKLVKLLLNMGANINHKNKKEQTALHNAACNKHMDVVNFLIKHGADTTTLDDLGMTCQDLINY
jgi:ankyrin repeat protein